MLVSRPKMLTEISGNGAWGFLDLIRRNGLRDKLATQIGGYFTHAPKHERHLQLFLPPQERMKSNRPVCRPRGGVSMAVDHKGWQRPARLGNHQLSLHFNDLLCHSQARATRGLFAVQ